MQYYVIDLETNGLRTGWHEVTQLSIIRCTDLHQLTRYIKPKFPQRSDPRALEVTGRTLADLNLGIPAKEAVELVDGFINEDGMTSEHRCMIGHNVSFDRRFSYELWRTLGKVFPAVCWLDTMPWSKKYATHMLGMENPKKNLHASLTNLGLKPLSGAHEAQSDTRNTYMLYDFLYNKKKFDHLPYIKREPQEIEKFSSDDSAETIE